MLYLKGGIYSDTDTTLLKDPARWGQGAKLWRDGAGWLDSASLDRLEAGEEASQVLPPPSIVVGIEADVGDREDWYDWWPRPVSLLLALPSFHRPGMKTDGRCKSSNGPWLLLRSILSHSLLCFESSTLQGRLWIGLIRTPKRSSD